MEAECESAAGASAIVTMNTRDFVAAAVFGIGVWLPGALVARLRDLEA